MYTFHVTFGDQAAVQDLTAATRERLASLGGLDLVPGRWLHLTTQSVGFTDEVTDADLTAITAAARKRLAALSPVQVTIGAPEVAIEGIASPAGPDAVLTPARDAVRAAIADVWGPDRVPEGPEWLPHISIAYAAADGPGGRYAAAVAGLGTAQATVSRIDLIRLGRDEHVYEWETVAALPFGS